MKEATTRTAKPVGLRQQVLLAALDCSGGDLDKTFTAEDLLLAAWTRDPSSWGLRAHERKYPDSEKIYKEIDRVSVGGKNVPGGLVGLGLLDQVRKRTYRLTPKGISEASGVVGATPTARPKAERALADAVAAILSHPVFIEWQNDPLSPKQFRDAGHFWGIAPGTPPSVIRTRIANVDNTLDAARSVLDERAADEVSAQHGRTLFDRNDIERAAEFQLTIKQRFAHDLATLQVTLT